MKILFFGKKITLDNTQSECLKVCILESIQNAENDMSNFETNTKEYAVLDTKRQLLTDIAKKLELIC